MNIVRAGNLLQRSAPLALEELFVLVRVHASTCWLGTVDFPRLDLPNVVKMQFQGNWSWSI